MGRWDVKELEEELKVKVAKKGVVIEQGKKMIECDDKCRW